MIRHLRSRNLHIAIGAMVFVTVASACGPFFSPDVFIRANRPDLPANYVAGQLGILEPSFPRADLLVAYRYLDGGSLDATEQKAWQPTYSEMEPEWEAQSQAQNPPPPVIMQCTRDGCTQNIQNPQLPVTTPLGAWLKARATYPDPPAASIDPQRGYKHTFPGGGEYEDQFLNCADSAFTTATATLADRAQKWGKDSASLHNWLQAQDMVFANCHAGSAVPQPAPPGSPALLVSDRAYQTASANFYALSLDQARSQFAAIGNDKNSPWQPVAGYLAARALVRQAFFSTENITPQNNYNPALMKAAAAELRNYLSTAPPPYHRAAENLLDLIRIRIDPAQRAPELAKLVAGPAHDPDYAQDLTDLLWRVNLDTPDGLRPQLDGNMVPDEKHPGQMRPQTQADVDARAHTVYTQTESVRAYAPIVDWVITVQSADPASATHAIHQWQQARTLPWLVAALMKANGTEPQTSQLIAAASAVPANSPAWQTVAYHRIRLLLASGHAEEARSLFEQTMPRITQSGEMSSVNAFRGLAMGAASTLADFLKFAPKTILLFTSQEKNAVNDCDDVMKDPKRHYSCVAEVDPLQLDQDAVTILNQQAPLATWLAAAKSPELAQQLRHAIAMQGWTRAVLLKNEAAASDFRALLPQGLQTQTTGSGAFTQWIALARNPGLNPFLNAGTQRAYSWDFVESYRDNWCYNGDANSAVVPPVAFLSAVERAEGSKQFNALGSATATQVAQKIVDYVTAHPAEPRAAESLYLVLRMARYGCVEPAEPPAKPDAKSPPQPPPAYTSEQQQLLSIKQQAARLLRQRYASSPWTRKAAPFVG
jgi:hypothetical protein